MISAIEVLPLGEVVTPTRPRVKPADYPDLPFIGMEHIEAHSMELLGTVPAGEMKSSAVYFKPGDVLYGRLRPYLNKVYQPSFEGLCSAEFIVLPENERVDGAYLQYFLNSSAFVRYASNLNTGDRPRVDFDQLAPYKIPLPPKSEQRRIVAEIEKQFSRLDEAVANLKRVKANLKRYKAAVLKAAVEGRLVPNEAELARREGRDYETGDQLLQRILEIRRERWKGSSKYKEPAALDSTDLPELPEGWAWATVDQLAALETNAITDGPFGSNLKTEHYQGTGPRVIRLQNIKDGEFADECAHITQEHFERLRKHEIYSGDIVIASLGDNPPRACVIPVFVGPAIVKADCIRFKPHPALTTAYLNAALNCLPTRHRVKNILHGIGRPRLSLGEIRAIVLPVPPETEQHRIVAEIDRRLSLVREVETEVDANRKRAERLRSAILNRVFSGRLFRHTVGMPEARSLLPTDIDNHTTTA